MNKSLYRRFAEWIRKWPLIVSVAVWVVLAILLFAFLAQFWAGWDILSPLSDKKDPDIAIKLVQIVMLLVGGIGAVGYLVIKYQERNAGKREEQRTLEDRTERSLSAAINMLGDSAPSTRLAGVYALADIADKNRGGYRQRVVNILCGYLRTKRIDDNAVESTIISTTRTHLLKKRDDENPDMQVNQLLEDDQLWCDCEFDFHGSFFCEALDLKNCTFDTAVSFGGATFGNGAYFDGATFGDGAYFDGATFGDEALFAAATFGDEAYFGAATFGDEAYFGGAKFGDWARFDSATFGDRARFDCATFGDGARFETATLPVSCSLQENNLPKGAKWKNSPPTFSDDSKENAGG